MKLSLSVFGSTTSTVEAPRGAQYSRLSGPAQIPLFSLPCFLPLRPPVPEPVNGGRRCRACGALQYPPTTACGATSVFETPSVLRESLPSYSAKPGAFYAPRALRWTTPPRGRTDPFQGPKIKPMFIDFRCFFKTILGSKMEAKMKSTSSQHRAWAPSKTLLEPGCRWKPFWPPFGSVFGPLEPLKIMLSL